jgi:hypothetical protein
MKSPFIALMIACAVASVVASMLTVFIARRWLGLSLGTALSELRVAAFAGVCQGIAAPFFFGGGLLGIFSIGLFPIWAVFSLAHRDRWDFFDGLKFSGLQAVILLLLAIPLTTPVLR